MKILKLIDHEYDIERDCIVFLQRNNILIMLINIHYDIMIKFYKNVMEDLY